MPGTIIESATFDPTVEVPSDGEGATSASLKDTFVQRLANRARYLYAAATTTGWWRWRTVTSEGLLRGQVVTGTGDLVFWTGMGFYRYVAGDTTAEDIPWIIESDFGGRWFHVLTDLRAAVSGIATLTSGGRLAQLPPNALIAQAFANYGTLPNADVETSTVNAWTDTSIYVSQTNVQIGDDLFAHCDLVGFADAGITGAVRLAYEHNGTVTGIDASEKRFVNAGATDFKHLHLMARKTVASSFSPATPHKFLVQIKSNGADAVRVKGMVMMAMQQVRP